MLSENFLPGLQPPKHSSANLESLRFRSAQDPKSNLNILTRCVPMQGRLKRTQASDAASIAAETLVRRRTLPGEWIEKSAPAIE